jgi:YspA, cpYpsA-related SLOG family
MSAYGVIGSRTFNDYELVKEELDKHEISKIVSGGAKGADSLAEKYAYENNLPVEIFKPDWSLGRHAGFIRNKTIVEHSDTLIAFWDGVSKGTLSSIRYGEEAGKHTIIVRYN